MLNREGFGRLQDMGCKGWGLCAEDDVLEGSLIGEYLGALVPPCLADAANTASTVQSTWRSSRSLA